MLQPSFREGFAQLASAGLSYDAWLLHTQITELTDLARDFPDTTIILDHFGGPARENWQCYRQDRDNLPSLRDEHSQL